MAPSLYHLSLFLYSSSNPFCLSVPGDSGQPVDLRAAHSDGVPGGQVPPQPQPGLPPPAEPQTIQVKTETLTTSLKRGSHS